MATLTMGRHVPAFARPRRLAAVRVGRSDAEVVGALLEDGLEHIGRALNGLSLASTHGSKGAVVE